VGKTEGKRPFGRPRRRWKTIVNGSPESWMGWWGLDGVGSGNGQAAGNCMYGNELSGSIKMRGSS
jgi:hypothetical protein